MQKNGLIYYDYNNKVEPLSLNAQVHWLVYALLV